MSLGFRIAETPLLCDGYLLLDFFFEYRVFVTEHIKGGLELEAWWGGEKLLFKSCFGRVCYEGCPQA